MSKQQVLLEVINIGKEYSSKPKLAEINFTQPSLQKLAIVGASGSGKTTLLKIMSGNLQPTTGKVLFGGERVVGPDEKLLPGHPKMGYLSQNYELLNNYKVADLIWFDNKLKTEEANRIFEICQINHLLKRRTDEVSGGEKQRIAICKLLIKSPQLLLLDEPFSNLDLIHKNILKSVLEDIAGKLNITCILASHDPQDTLSWADKILVMQDGQIVQQGTPAQVYHQPVSEYVAGLFGKYNLLNAQQVKQLLGNTMFIHKTQQLLIRPEQLFVSTLDNALFAARVVNISFWGSHYQITLEVDGISLTMYTLAKEVALGEILSIAFDKENTMLIDEIL